MPKKYTIDFGEHHEQAQIDQTARRLHELLELEKELIVKDFKEIKKLKKEENIEEKAIKHFESQLQELLATIAYLEGYVQEIEAGNTMLKHNTSVQKLGQKLKDLSKELHQCANSLLEEEQKMVKLSKHIHQVLNKAKKYEELIFA